MKNNKKNKKKKVVTTKAVTTEESVSKEVTIEEVELGEILPEETEASRGENISGDDTEIKETFQDETEVNDNEVKNKKEVESTNFPDKETAAEGDENTNFPDKETAAEGEVEETDFQNEEATADEVVKSSKLKSLMHNKRFTITGSIILLLIILYGCFTYYYSNLFFIGTKINGLDCSNMTAEEAEATIRDKVEDYELTIEFRDGNTEVISGDSIEYKYVPDGSVQRLLDAQNPFVWIAGVFSPSSYEVPETIEYSKSLLASEYYALSSTADDKRVAPVNAYVTYEGDEFVIVPEDEGNHLDHHAFLLEINDIVSSSGTKVAAADYDIYARPTIYRDSADLAKECEQLNQLADVSVTYTLPGGEVKVLDGNEVRNWLSLDEQGNYTISDEEMQDKIAAFVKQFAGEVNTVGAARTFQSTMQGEVTVEGGSYGWKIDQKAESAQLAEEIASHAVVTREPVYASRELTTENSGIGNTYIEIDLTNQHLWYYIDGQLYVESDIVSGTYYTSSRRTPPGIFLLTYKQRNKVLRGRLQADGTYEYESPVSFWMPFNGGIGLHDATWRGSFGGTIYKYSGSHGCINMPYKNAEKVYEKIDKETPIICFY